MLMTHDDWVKQQRAEAVKTANRIRAGEIGIIEGSRQLVALCSGVESQRLEALLAPFVVIESETDHLPGNEQKGFWAPGALAAAEAAISDAESRFRADAMAACANLIAGLEQAV